MDVRRDHSLIITADMIQKSFGSYGVATRCAGDEFVVMLNTTVAQLIGKMIADAKSNLVEENEKSHGPYQLSAAMGYGIANLSNE